jgi:hypothetical protein
MFRCKNTIIREHTIWALLKLQLLKLVNIHWCGSFGGVALYFFIWPLCICVCVCVCVCGTGRRLTPTSATHIHLRLFNCALVGEKNLTVHYCLHKSVTTVPNLSKMTMPQTADKSPNIWLTIHTYYPKEKSVMNITRQEIDYGTCITHCHSSILQHFMSYK